MVNDGSNDRSYDIVCSLSTSIPQLSVYSQKNSGVCIARNNALKVARGKYIVFVDSDDYVEKAYVSSILEAVSAMRENGCQLTLFSHYVEEA